MGMSMNMPDSSSADTSSAASASMAMMVPYLHFAGGDKLFFKSLAPSSADALAGASIILFLLAILERGIFAGRNVLEARWRQAALDNTDVKDDGASTTDVTTSLLFNRTRPSTFVFSHNALRGMLYALQALFSYALMLAVMTFQGAYIIAIVIGLGLGELAFGHFAAMNTVATSPQCC